MDQTQRQKIIQRIKKLMAVTTQAGAAENEAMKAASMATDLMDDYGISFAEVQERTAEGWEYARMTPKERWKAEFLAWIASRLGQFAGAVSMGNKTKGGKIGTVTFFGAASDVIFAEWLAKAVCEFVFAGYQRELKEHRKSNLFMSRHDLNLYRNGYLYGAAKSINARLEAMIAERVGNQVARGALTVLGKVDAAMAELEKKTKLNSLSLNVGRVSHQAMVAGAERGNAVQFHKPVAQSGALMIGKN